MVSEAGPDLIFFGGTFDPPHLGHVDCVKSLSVRFPSSKILIAPGFQPAGQAGKHKSPKASFEMRMEMCNLAFKDINSKNIEISNIESLMPSPNYTFRVLQKLHSDFSGKNIALCIGQDQIAGFDTWKNPKEIVNQFSLIVAKRNTGSLELGSLMEECESTLSRLDLSVAWLSNESGKIGPIGHQLYLLDENICGAESTLLRSQLGNNKEAIKGWLPKKIENYIKENHIYLR